VAGPSDAAVDFAALQQRLEQAEAVLAGAHGPEERRRILDERARAVSRVREDARTDGVPVLAFRVGGERYAVEVAAVFGVLDARGLSPLPASPPWLLGALVARTRVVPVLDLRALLGLEGGGMIDLVKVVVVEHDGDVFGLAAEELEGRLDVPRAGLAAAAQGPFAWIAPDRLALLDLGRIGAPSARGA
jgi:purine-binding chemotaxis protein CheW